MTSCSLSQMPRTCNLSLQQSYLGWFRAVTIHFLLNIVTNLERILKNVKFIETFWETNNNIEQIRFDEVRITCCLVNWVSNVLMKRCSLVFNQGRTSASDDFKYDSWIIELWRVEVIYKLMSISILVTATHHAAIVH